MSFYQVGPQCQCNSKQSLPCDLSFNNLDNLFSTKSLGLGTSLVYAHSPHSLGMQLLMFVALDKYFHTGLSVSMCGSRPKPSTLVIYFN
jgi:hypothetical protein